MKKLIWFIVIVVVILLVLFLVILPGIGVDGFQNIADFWSSLIRN